jgi:hypothetical protein
MWEGGERTRYWREGEERREMRVMERKKQRQIPNDERKEIEWVKEIWKRRDRMEKERGGVRKKIFFWNFYFLNKTVLTVGQIKHYLNFRVFL